MTRTLVIAAGAMLLASAAFAQGTGNLGAQQPGMGSQAPATQQGSGQRAGGPASELNRGATMAAPRALGRMGMANTRGSRG